VKLLWLPRAESDLDGICDYIGQYNPHAAWNIYQHVRGKVEALPVQPGLGRPGRVHGTRELVITNTPYLVAYTVRPLLDAVVILRVMHGAQQWPSELDEE
jgi:toxin ParE1/3/4